jgi:hypothetical protein
MYTTFCQICGRRRTLSAHPLLLMSSNDRPTPHVSIALALSSWRRDHHRTDSSYRVSMADVPVSPVSSAEGDPRQRQQYEPLHCHEG